MDKLLIDDGVMVVSIPLEKKGLKPYDVDTEIYSLYFENNFFTDVYFNYKNAQYFFPTIKKTKTTRESGVNAFGVTGRYEMERGAIYGVYVDELNKKLYGKSTSPLYTLTGISPDQAKRFNSNLEVFLIAKPRVSPKGVMACESLWFEEPKITSDYAWHLNLRIVNVKPIALLFCDKSSKEVLKQILF